MYGVWNIRMVQRFAAENYCFIWAHVSSRRELTGCSYFQHRLFFFTYEQMTLFQRRFELCFSISFPFLFYKRATFSQEKQPFSINANHPGLPVSLMSAYPAFIWLWGARARLWTWAGLLVGLSSGKDRRGLSACKVASLLNAELVHSLLDDTQTWMKQ